MAEKSLGKILHEAQEQWWFDYEGMVPQDYSELTQKGREVKEYAAQAVRNAVIEECIDALEVTAGFRDTPPTR